MKRGDIWTVAGGKEYAFRPWRECSTGLSPFL
jgi:hypothetical protein